MIPFREQQSVSTEETFDSDTIDISFIKKEVVRMTEKIAFDLRSKNKLTGCVSVKIRYSDFQTEQKQSSIDYTASDQVLIQKVKELFDRLYLRRQLIRLVGVRFADLIAGTYQINLFSDTQEMIKLYRALTASKNNTAKSI